MSKEDKTWDIGVIVLCCFAIAFFVVLAGFAIYWHIESNNYYVYKTEQGSFGEADDCRAIHGNLSCRVGDKVIEVSEYERLKK